MTIQFTSQQELTDWLNENITDNNTREVLLLLGFRNGLSLCTNCSTINIPNGYLDRIYENETRLCTNMLMDILPISAN